MWNAYVHVLLVITQLNDCQGYKKPHIGPVWHTLCSDLWGRRGEVVWGAIWHLVGASWWFPAAPAVLPYRNPAPGSLPSPILAQGKSNSFLLSLNHCNRLHKALRGEEKNESLNLWAHQAAWERAEIIFLVSDSWPCPQLVVGYRQVPSLWTSVSPSVKWQLEAHLETPFQVDGSGHSRVLCLRDTKLKKASSCIKEPNALWEIHQRVILITVFSVVHLL